MPVEELFKVGTIEQDTLDSLNAMFGELFTDVAALQGGAQADNASATVALIVSSDGVTTLLPAATVARRVIISVQVTEIFANGDGAQPTHTIGETGSAAKFAAAARFTGAAAGTTFSFAGTLSADVALIITSVAGTGTTMTGAIDVTAIASAQ